MFDHNIMTWRDFQIKPVLDCEQEVKIETEVATVEEKEKEVRTLVHEEEEERIPAKKEEDCTIDPLPQNMETK